MPEYLHLMKRPARYRAPALMVSFVLLVAGAGLFYSAYESFSGSATTSAETAAIRSLLSRKPVITPSRKELDAAKRWAALREERDFNWYRVFRAVEAVSNADIELLEFQPEKASRRLTLRGEARNLAALIAYVSALSEQPDIEQAYLANQKTRTDGVLNPVLFEVRAQLGP